MKPLHSSLGSDFNIRKKKVIIKKVFIWLFKYLKKNKNKLQYFAKKSVSFKILRKLKIKVLLNKKILI